MKNVNFKKIKSLTKVFLKTSFQNSEMAMGFASNKKANKDNKKSGIGKKVLYGFIFLYVAAIMTFISYGILKELIALQQEQVFLGMILLAVAAFLLIQSIFSSINILYFSNDNTHILPLPVTAAEIVIAKTNVMLITEYVMEAIIGLVPLILFGILTGASILYYFVLAIVFFVFPLVPIVIASLLGIIVMSFSKFMKDKNRFQLIATVITVALVLICTFAMNGSSQREMTQEQVLQMATQANGLVQIVENYFITLRPTIQALAASVTMSQLAFVGIEVLKLLAITAIVYVLYLFLAQKLYLRGAVGNLESGKKTRKKLDNKTAFTSKGLANSYIKKEWKILIRNPIFFMQCVLPAVLLPVIMIGAVAIQFSSIPIEEMGQMREQIEQFPSMLIICVILGIIQFFSMLIFISPTAISRDGKNAVFMKYIPVSFYKQLLYKAAPNFMADILMIVVVLVIVQYFMQLNWLLLLVIFALAILMSAFQSLLMLVVDLKNPKLEWDSEYAVVKQNMNLMWPSILGMASMALLIGIAIFLGNYPEVIGILIIALLYGTLLWGTKRYLEKNETKLQEKIN